MAKKNGSTKAQRIMAAADACGWTFTWEADDSPDLSWMTPEELGESHDVLGCILMDRRGHVLESLWGIVDPDPAYGREIEAQLAEEAMLSIRAALLEAI